MMENLKIEKAEIEDGHMVTGMYGNRPYKAKRPFIRIEDSEYLGTSIEVQDYHGSRGIFLLETEDEVQALIDKLIEVKEIINNER